MNFFLLGTGRVAHFIAGRSVAAGWNCAGVWGRNKEAANALAASLKAPVVESMGQVSGGADAILVALSDNAISQTAQALPLQKATLVHFSGTLPLEALLPHPNRAVCWPVYSIASGIAPSVKIPFAGEAASPVAEKLLQQFAGELCGSLTLMNAKQRAQLHLSAVLANNFINHLLVLSGTLAAEAGLSFELLQPLIAQTLERAAGGPENLLQTGPAVRGDTETEAAHLQLLTAHPGWKRVYEALSHSIKQLYKQRAGTPEW